MLATTKALKVLPAINRSLLNERLGEVLEGGIIASKQTVLGQDYRSVIVLSAAVANEKHICRVNRLN